MAAALQSSSTSRRRATAPPTASSNGRLALSVQFSSTAPTPATAAASPSSGRCVKRRSPTTPCSRGGEHPTEACTYLLGRVRGSQHGLGAQPGICPLQIPVMASSQGDGPMFPDGIPSGATAAKTRPPYIYGQRRGQYNPSPSLSAPPLLSGPPTYRKVLRVLKHIEPGPRASSSHPPATSPPAELSSSVSIRARAQHNFTNFNDSMSEGVKVARGAALSATVGGGVTARGGALQPS